MQSSVQTVHGYFVVPEAAIFDNSKTEYRFTVSVDSCYPKTPPILKFASPIFHPICPFPGNEADLKELRNLIAHESDEILSAGELLLGGSKQSKIRVTLMNMKGKKKNIELSIEDSLQDLYAAAKKWEKGLLSCTFLLILFSIVVRDKCVRLNRGIDSPRGWRQGQQVSLRAAIATSKLRGWAK